jgi:pyrimidine-specific ribonucleoside hydrolase
MKNIILDCDPGHEDFFGLLLAVANPSKVNLLAVTTTVAYQTALNVQNNAMKALTLLGRPDIPVAKGAAKPLVEPFGLADNWQDFTGLDGADFPKPAQTPSDLMSIELMAQQVRNAEGQVTIAVSGPLTNVGLFLAAFPDLHDKIAEVVVMGGALNTGNRRPGVEYNFSIDPEAAAMVLGSGVPVTLVTRDLTKRGIITPATVDAMRAINTTVAQVAADLMSYYGDFESDEPVVLNDPEVLAYLIDPSLFSGKKMAVQVELQGAMTRGQLVADVDGMTDWPQNALVLTELDNDGFVQMILDALLTVKA